MTNKNILQLARELDLNLNKPNIRKPQDYIERIANAVATAPIMKELLPRYTLMSDFFVEKFGVMKKNLSERKET